jgi:putative ABC transport system permease protein
MFKALNQSIKVLKANPVRTVLTTLGIVIGIATVILVLSAGAGFRGFIDAQIASWGSNTLFVETRVPPTTKNLNSNSAQGADASRAGSTIAITSFKIKDLENIKRLQNVENAYGMAVGLGVASYRGNEKSVIYYGASVERFDIDKHELRSGRFYTKEEELSAGQVVILGSSLADNLFVQDDPINKFIRIGNLNFQVIGVYKPQGAAGGPSADDSLYMPLRTAQKKMLGIDYITVGVVQIKNTDLGDSTAEEIKQTMRQSHNITDPNKDDFTVTTQAQVLDTFNTIFNGITVLLICIASISLVVGGVGIMNIMYVVVTERTSEIGLKKALGAKNKDILIEFLVESVIVTIIGGILGILLGAFGGWIISLIATASGLDWVFVVPLYSILLGVGVSATIGIGFGVLPARSASRLDPVEAMRYE